MIMETIKYLLFLLRLFLKLEITFKLNYIYINYVSELMLVICKEYEIGVYFKVVF